MTPDQFAAFLRTHPLLAEQLRDLAVIAPTGKKPTLGLMAEARRTLFLLPILRFILGQLGTPWQAPNGQYDDLQRQRFAHWAQQSADTDGRDLAATSRSGERILRFLDLMKSPQLQSDWDSLQALMLETSARQP